ncbi:MAG: hypothetical protein IPH75_12870 [bacterium]|nr:hypothetical protein [bacterium]
MAIPKKKPLSSGGRPSTAQLVRAPEKWPFGRKNYILFAVSLVVIVIGFFALSQGSTSLAPVLLVVGYCVLVPWAILAKEKQASEPPSESAAPETKVS